MPDGAAPWRATTIVPAMWTRWLRPHLVAVAQRHRRLRGLLWRVARWSQGRHYVGAVGVVFDPDGHVLIAEHALRERALGLPGGWVKRQEDPRRAVAREILEETGLSTGAVQVVGCEDHSAGGTRRSTGMTVAFLCELQPGTGTAVRPMSIELTAVHWATGAEADARLSAFERRAVEVARAMRSSGVVPTAR